MSFILSSGIVQPPLTAGGVAYGNGSQVFVSAAGTAGQVLTSNGASAPTWSTVGGTTMLFAAFSLALN